MLFSCVCLEEEEAGREERRGEGIVTSSHHRVCELFTYVHLMHIIYFSLMFEYVNYSLTILP